MKKVIKKMLALVSVGTMVLSMVGCGNKGTAGTEAKETAAKMEKVDSVDKGEVLKLKVGWPTSGQEGDVILPGIDVACKYVTEKSGGRIQFDYFPNQQLGTESDMCDQMILGDLDIGVISNSAAATYWPQLYLVSLPFAFDSVSRYYDLMGINGVNNGEALNALRDAVESKGDIHLFNAVCCTYRGMQSNKHAITSADDFKGMTVRVQAGQIYADIYDALNATIASIPFGELYTAMQNGTVNVEDVGIATCYTNRYYEVEEYAVELNHCMCANYFMMSNACWDKLTEEERQWFTEGCALAEQAAEEAVVKADTAAYESYADAGAKVIRYNELAPEEIQKFKDMTAKVWDKYRDIVGADIYDNFVNVLKEAGIR